MSNQALDPAPLLSINSDNNIYNTYHLSSPQDDDEEACSSISTQPLLFQNDSKCSYASKWILFFFLGLINNLPGVVVLSSAKSLSKQFHQDHLMGLLNWASIGFGLIAKISAATFLLRVPTHTKMTLTFILFITGLSLLTLSTHVGFDLAIVSILMIGTASSIGESTLLGYFKYFHPKLVGAWSSGTGMAGIAGTGLYLLLFSCFHLSNFIVFFCLTPLSIVYYSVFLYLSYSHGPDSNNYQQITLRQDTSIDSYNDDLTSNKNIRQNHPQSGLLLPNQPTLAYNMYQNPNKTITDGIYHQSLAPTGAPSSSTTTTTTALVPTAATSSSLYDIDDIAGLTSYSFVKAAKQFPDRLDSDIRTNVGTHGHSGNTTATAITNPPSTATATTITNDGHKVISITSHHTTTGGTTDEGDILPQPEQCSSISMLSSILPQPQANSFTSSISETNNLQPLPSTTPAISTTTPGVLPIGSSQHQYHHQGRPSSPMLSSASSEHTISGLSGLSSSVKHRDHLYTNNDDSSINDDTIATNSSNIASNGADHYSFLPHSPSNISDAILQKNNTNLLLSNNTSFDDQPVSAASEETFFPQIKRVWPQMGHLAIMLGLIYFFEYCIITILASHANPNPKDTDTWAYRNAYEILQCLYQIGVFCSRSSIDFIQIRRTWVLTGFQIMNFIIWTLHDQYFFLNPLYIQFFGMIFVGTLAGLCYVGTFYAIQNDAQLGKDKEFAVNVASIGVNLGITLSSFYTLLADNTWMRHDN